MHVINVPALTTSQKLVLSPQAATIHNHIRRTGSITARDAMADYGITSATLARRMCDLEVAGFRVVRERKEHPITGKRYTRYVLGSRR